MIEGRERDVTECGGEARRPQRVAVAMRGDGAVDGRGGRPRIVASRYAAEHGLRNGETWWQGLVEC